MTQARASESPLSVRAAGWIARDPHAVLAPDGVAPLVGRLLGRMADRDPWPRTFAFTRRDAPDRARARARAERSQSAGSAEPNFPVAGFVRARAGDDGAGRGDHGDLHRKSTGGQPA